jgi:hypothetical protein
MKETGNVADRGGKHHARIVTRTESASSASTSGRQHEGKGEHSRGEAVGELERESA